MAALRSSCLLALLLPLALASCGNDTPAPAAKPAAAVPAPAADAEVQAAAQNPSTEVSAEEMGKLTHEVFSRFKKNFPQVAEFSTAPVVIRIQPVSGVEMFEVITPNGVFYTDRQAQWIIEGVMFIPDPATAAQTATASTGLPTALINITLREDAQRLFAMLRDKEAAAASMGSEQISGAEFFESMPRDKAVMIDYGTPPADGAREIVLLADLDDPASHTLFQNLAKQDPAQLNIRIALFPIGLEEIRPQTLDRAGALLCAGFDPANVSDPAATSRVAAVWKKALEDSSTTGMSDEAWTQWTTANNVAPAAHEACPRRAEPGLFTRLISTLGMMGSPRAVLKNGENLVGPFTVEQLLESLDRPAASAQAPEASAQTVAQ